MHCEVGSDNHTLRQQWKERRVGAGFDQIGPAGKKSRLAGRLDQNVSRATASELDYVLFSVQEVRDQGVVVTEGLFGVKVDILM